MTTFAVRTVCMSGHALDSGVQLLQPVPAQLHPRGQVRDLQPGPGGHTPEGRNHQSGLIVECGCILSTVELQYMPAVVRSVLKVLIPKFTLLKFLIIFYYSSIFLYRHDIERKRRFHNV